MIFSQDESTTNLLFCLFNLSVCMINWSFQAAVSLVHGSLVFGYISQDIKMTE